MILEGIVTSMDVSGALNIAPMGPIVDESMTTLHLRPFRTSTTYQNLAATGCGVFHVVDDVLLLAQAAVGTPDPVPELIPARIIDGQVIASACRWYEFRVTEINDDNDRTDLMVDVVHSERLRDFFGFNRARHAVLEAAILVTRLHLLDADDVLQQVAALSSPVRKTAGRRELEAFNLLDRHIREHIARFRCPAS